jgi:hypothetical protein
MDPVYGRPDQIKLIAEAQLLRAEATRHALRDMLRWAFGRHAA